MKEENLQKKNEEGRMNREKGQGERRIEEYGAEAEGKKNGQGEREKKEISAEYEERMNEKSGQQGGSGNDLFMTAEKKLTCEQEELYRELQKRNLYFLREYGRKVGVSRPTSKKKGKLIEEIVKILTKAEPPSKRSGRGAPPKSFSFGEDCAAASGNAVAVLKLTRREFALLAELVCLGNIIAAANGEKEKTERCRELTFKICRQCFLFMGAGEKDRGQGDPLKKR